MSWYIHPSKQLRDDELPPELVVTNRDGSIEQAYVPYDASGQPKAENAKLRELVAELENVRKAFCSVNETRGVPCECCPAMLFCDTNPIQRMHELGVEVDE